MPLELPVTSAFFPLNDISASLQRRMLGPLLQAVNLAAVLNRLHVSISQVISALWHIGDQESQTAFVGSNTTL
jgi:hypothetical protein